MIHIRNCDDTGLDADTFRKCLHHYLSDALAAPQQEKFVLSQSGVKAMNEEDFVRLFNAGKKDTTGMVIINDTTEE